METALFDNPALGVNGNYIQKPEQNFSLQLIHRFLIIKENPDNQELYAGLTTHFDTPKARLKIRPDFVLHQCPSNRERQEIFAEVKITDVSFYNDFKKLKMSITLNHRDIKGLNFNYAVMVAVNKSLDKTETEIRNSTHFRELSNDDLGKLYLFHAVKNPDGNSATYTVKNFLEIKNG